jgi:type I restriction enzyme S subunit
MGNLINKPRIRFPEFKDTWEYTKLNELLNESKKLNEDLRFGKDDVLSVSGELGIVNQIEHLGRSYAGVSVHKYHIVEPGDIVYTKSPLKANPFGIIKLNKGKAGIVSTLYAVYKVNQETAYGPFIDYYFSLDANTNRYLRPLVKKGAKNDMKINNNYVLHDQIFAPTISEQKQIATFFTVIDKKITELKQKKLLLGYYKKGIVQKIFSRKIRFKDINGEGYPDWESKKLGELAKFSKGKGISKSDINEYGKNECIRYGELYTYYGEIIDEVKSKTNIELNNMVISEANDVIIPASGETQIDIATASCVLKSGIGLGGDLNIIKTKKNGVFLSYYLNNRKKYDIASLAQGISVVHLYSNQLALLDLEIPCLAEQDMIAKLLAALDEKINQCQKQVEKMELWEKGLLQRMFC